MDLAALVGSFPVNRQLSEQERQLQLKQEQHLDISPHYQLSVIEMNSVYLETVDKWYGSKGWITLIATTIIMMLATAYGALAHVAMTRDSQTARGDDDVAILIFAATLFIPMIVVAWWMLRKEAFAYTHYPIRFDRAKRMVHVFRTNGSVLSVPWDSVIFTMAEVDRFYRY